MHNHIEVFPNPFTQGTTLKFKLTTKASVAIEIIDVIGRKIIELPAGDLSEGAHEFFWDGNSETGSETTAGVYYAKTKINGVEFVSRLVHMK